MAKGGFTGAKETAESSHGPLLPTGETFFLHLHKSCKISEEYLKSAPGFNYLCFPRNLHISYLCVYFPVVISFLPVCLGGKDQALERFYKWQNCALHISLEPKHSGKMCPVCLSSPILCLSIIQWPHRRLQRTRLSKKTQEQSVHSIILNLVWALRFCPICLKLRNSWCWLVNDRLLLEQFLHVTGKSLFVSPIRLFGKESKVSRLKVSRGRHSFNIHWVLIPCR